MQVVRCVCMYVCRYIHKVCSYDGLDVTLCMYVDRYVGKQVCRYIGMYVLCRQVCRHVCMSQAQHVQWDLINKMSKPSGVSLGSSGFVSVGQWSHFLVKWGYLVGQLVTFSVQWGHFRSIALRDGLVGQWGVFLGSSGVVQWVSGVTFQSSGVVQWVSGVTLSPQHRWA